ncbi:hypothetical protein T492DRAFT_864180 [Pavlovales sp. CCMP2436]|nr:hypothetical protein T492DRAFT_864180 [Pavlovales sp. CCMP2436]
MAAKRDQEPEGDLLAKVAGGLTIVIVGSGIVNFLSAKTYTEPIAAAALATNDKLDDLAIKGLLLAFVLAILAAFGTVLQDHVRDEKQFGRDQAYDQVQFSCDQARNQAQFGRDQAQSGRN